MGLETLSASGEFIRLLNDHKEKPIYCKAVDACGENCRHGSRAFLCNSFFTLNYCFRMKKAFSQTFMTPFYYEGLNGSGLVNNALREVRKSHDGFCLSQLMPHAQQ